jgi:hypothetical protein
VWSRAELDKEGQKIEFLWETMEASDYLQAPRLKQWAVPLIASHPDADPFKTISMAFHYNITSWLPRAASYIILNARWDQLLNTPFAVEIGARAFNILVRAKFSVMRNTAESAYNTPFDWYVHCSNHELCSEAWHQKWWGKLARNLLVPDEDRAWSGHQAMEAVKEVTAIPGMCTKCLESTKEYIKENDPWVQEKVFVEDALKELAALVRVDLEDEN